MISSKHIDKIIAAAVVLAVWACLFIIYASAKDKESPNISEYQKKLFNDEIAIIDIIADKKEWRELIDDAEKKDWISCDLIINGEIFNGVGIRTKGNSSLSKVEKSENGRHSLNIKLNKYVKGQTYYGLDTFCLNNMLGDATYMKEYISYDITRYIGVPSPLTNYASVKVNGEDYGFMLVLERYDEAFLGRAFNTSSGQLYNVKNSNGNYGGSLIYTGSDKSGYSSIIENSVFKNKSEKHENRIITAIEYLNEGIDLEKYWDVDNILRYFAAQVTVVNLKSYLSSQEQNYYLYENKEIISVLPWSCRLSFGGYPKNISDASFFVNFPIDTPVYDVNMIERPLLFKLLEFPQYKEKYHEYLRQIANGYFLSGLFDETINNLNVKIGDYVKNDVSGFYSYEQYNKALPNFLAFGNLRAQSISGQLDGTVPSTARNQINDRSSLINASYVKLSELG